MTNDILIKGGQVVDGTGQRSYEGSVIVDGDSVTVMQGDTGSVNAGRTIDGSKYIVCPGFIDMHSHSDLMLLNEPRHEAKVRQGVTTEVLGMDGLSYAPASPVNLELLLQYLSAINGIPPEGVRWNSVRDFLSLFDSTCSCNTVYFVPHAAIRVEAMGWGDRLAGFFASNATHYIGCDPNPNTFAIYSEMIREYSKMSPGKTTQIYRCGAEDLPWETIENVDCAFTSPPYFATERYNEGGDFEEDQSWSKFSEYERWRDEFYLPVALNSFNALSEKGFLMTNIMDPKIKNVRYYSCDELVDHLQPDFLGQIGMRIMQRPQGKNKFETKEELVEFMNKLYIENVWCFGKYKTFDLFRHTRRATLEGLF